MLVKEDVLLLGAGFTHNFGGYLADQMWEHLFNRCAITQSRSLMNLMLNAKNNLNFEVIYSQLEEIGGKTFLEYGAALSDVFEGLDDLVLKARRPNHGIHFANFQSWLEKFRGTKEQPGFIFTLNQDLFFERHPPKGGIYLPGIPSHGQAGKVSESHPLRKTVLPNKQSFEELLGSLEDFNLIKLHGSCNWLSNDSTDAMALGGGKRKLIEKQPLLRAYDQLFANVMRSRCKRVWIIGYSFGDEHVNRALISALPLLRPRLCVIDPVRPRDFFEKLAKRPGAHLLRNSVNCFIPNTLKGIFPSNGDIPQPYEIIEKMMLQ